MGDLGFHSILLVDDRCGLLDYTECLNERGGQAFGGPANVKVLQ